MASRKVTIKDVAREAGVSVSAVSNALNGVNVLHPDTKQYILEVVDRLHYIPNLNGKNLKTQETKVVGLFFTSIRGPYYSILADSIYQGCKKYGYELNIFIHDRADNMMANILGRRIDGAIILNDHVGEKEVKLLLENETPVVFIDSAERLNGFRDVLKKAGITLEEDYILKGEYEREIAYNSVKDFLELAKPLPEAIFAVNDLSAIGTIEALEEEGIRVPEQVNVLGCDDIESARLVNPSVLTIRISFEKQGTLAINHLIRLIQGKEKGGIEILNGRIIPRESTCLRE